MFHKFHIPCSFQISKSEIKSQIFPRLFSILKLHIILIQIPQRHLYLQRNYRISPFTFPLRRRIPTRWKSDSGLGKAMPCPYVRHGSILHQCSTECRQSSWITISVEMLQLSDVQRHMWQIRKKNRGLSKRIASCSRTPFFRLGNHCFEILRMPWFVNILQA